MRRSAGLQNPENETFELSKPSQEKKHTRSCPRHCACAAWLRRTGGAGRGGGRGRDLAFEFPNIAGSASCPPPRRAPPRSSCRPRRGGRGQNAGHARPAQQVGSAPPAGGRGARAALDDDAGPRPSAAEPRAGRGGGAARGERGAARRRGRAATRGGAQHPALGLRAAARM